MTIYHCHLAVHVWCLTGCWCNVFAYKMWILHAVLIIFIFPEPLQIRSNGLYRPDALPVTQPTVSNWKKLRSSTGSLALSFLPLPLNCWGKEHCSYWQSNTRLCLSLMYCGALWTRHNKCRHICRIGCRAVVPRLGLGSCRIGPAPFPGLSYEATKPGFSCWWCSIFVLRMNVFFCCVRFSPEIVWEAEMTSFVSSWA